MEITLDKSLGRFQIRKKTYSISDIHAIQLLRFETVNRFNLGAGLPYMTHQINLIMNTRYGLDRVSFIEHSALKIIRKDSIELSNFLRVPIWDAMSYRTPSEDDLTHVKANLMFQQK